MSSSKLVERLRQIIQAPAARPAATPHDADKPECPESLPAGPGLGRIAVAPAGTGPGLCSGLERSLENILGGAWRDSADGGRSFVVERRVDGDRRHGRVSIGELAECHRRASHFAPLLSGGAPARPPFVFFDLETTGLSGGAGTLAFLVACGWFDADGSFVTRQHVLTEFSHERSMLGAMAGDLASAGTLVSFNGKSFDAPVLETRHLFHRLEWLLGAVPHIDVLHPSRNFWGRQDGSRSPLVSSRHEHSSTTLRQAPGRPFDPSMAAGFRNPTSADSARSRADRADVRSPWAAGNNSARSSSAVNGLNGGRRAKRECSLVALEEHVLGVRRAGDVSGFEIPGRYFQFVRSGDARPLVAVLEHNRLDLLSLAGLSGRLLGLLGGGAEEVLDAGEALALGHLYLRAGLDTPAHGAFERAASMAGSTAVRIDALRALACAARRARRHEEAARCWGELLEIPDCPQHAFREASEALAIHHEHRAGDLSLAKSFALRSLDTEARPAWNDAVQHRLARIERKIERRAELPGLFVLLGAG